MNNALAIAIDATRSAPDRVLAITQLRQADGKRAEAVLRDLLEDGAWMVREAALSALVGPLALSGYLGTAKTWLREHPSAYMRGAGISALQGYASWNKAGADLTVDLVEALLEEPDEGVRRGIWDTVLRIKRDSLLGSQVRWDEPLQIDWGIVSDELRRVSRNGDWRSRIDAALKRRHLSMREFVNSSKSVWFDVVARELRCDVYAHQVVAALAPSDEAWAESGWFGRLTLVRSLTHYRGDKEFSGRPNDARLFALDAWLSFHRRRSWGVEAERVRDAVLEQESVEWLPSDDEDDELRAIFESCAWST